MNRENRRNWQAELARVTGQEQDCELVSAIELERGHFDAITRATREYVCACFGIQADSVSDDELQDIMNTRLVDVANRTPNGALVPKVEFQPQYNAIHAATAAWFGSLGIGHLVDSIRCPIVVRAVSGAASPGADDRPYAASKLHVDLWAGDPPDSVAIIIPVLGDIENTTVEWFTTPEGFEEQYLRVVDDYDIADEFRDRCTRYPLDPTMGNAYFIDAVVPHRTVRRGGGTRVNLQFDLRRPLSAEESARMHTSFNTGRLGLYLPPDEWLSFGSEQFLMFTDTNADAKRGVFRKHQDGQRTYEIVESLPQETFH